MSSRTTPSSLAARRPIVSVVILLAIAGAFAIFVVLIAAVVLSDDPKPGDMSEERKRIRAERARTILSQLAAGNSAPPARLASLCDDAWKLDAASVTGPIKTRCAEAHLIAATERVREGHIAGARVALEAAKREGADKTRVSYAEERLARAEEKERKVAAAAAARTRQLEASVAAAKAKLDRELYARALRERFLDEGFDIKVRVAGDESDRLVLEYPLFSDVWAHQFRKQGLISAMKERGFRRVDMKAYDYAVSWDLSAR